MIKNTKRHLFFMRKAYRHLKVKLIEELTILKCLFDYVDCVFRFSGVLVSINAILYRIIFISKLKFMQLKLLIRMMNIMIAC